MGKSEDEMGRTWVSIRPACAADAAFLAELWSTSLRRADQEVQVRDLEAVLARVASREDERVMVAEYGGERAGAVFLRLSQAGVLNPDLVVQALHPTVLPRLRRHGVGRALMDAAVSFAEESGVPSIATAATSGAREANRFMARLGFASHATFRTAPTSLVRSRLSAGRSDPGASGRRIGQVLAARRSMRRAEQAPAEIGEVDTPAPLAP